MLTNNDLIFIFCSQPLDGLLGNQLPISAGSSIPPSQVATTSLAHVTHTSGKQVAPCIFFQKGFCLKGDWCPFLHGPNPTSNKAAQVPGTTASAEPVTFKHGLGELENGTQERKVPYISVLKSVELPLQAKSTLDVETVHPGNKLAMSRKIQQTSGINKEFSRYRPSGPPANNGNTVSGSSRAQRPNMFEERGGMETKDAEEISREPSPGFDVLVDNELGDSDYYPSEDQYRITRDHEERNEYGHSADYSSFADGDRDRMRTHRGRDSYDSVQGHYAWEQHRVSRESTPEGSAYLERRRYARFDGPDQVDETDLRHHLSKHRRSNGLKSVISDEFPQDKYAKNLSYHLRRDELVPQNESYLGSRLRGRIKLTGKSSTPIDGREDLCRGREINRGTDLGRLSPGGIHLSSHHGRLEDRIEKTVEQDFRNEGKNRVPRDMTGDNNGDFAGPKTLAELKIRKKTDSSEQHVNYQQSLGKRKHSVLDGHKQTSCDLSFEGPRSLEEILKRKRGEISGTGSGRTLSSNAEDNNPKNGKDDRTKISGLKNESSPLCNNKEAFQSASGNEAGAEETRSVGASKLEAEDVTIFEDDTNQKREGNEQKDYEQMDGEYYELDEGDNGDAEEEYPEDDDGDDEFAKKMGVMY